MTDLILSGSGPATLFTEGESRFSQGAMELGGMPWITMSVKGMKFTLRSPDGTEKKSKVGATMQMIILARAEFVNRTFYQEKYTEGSNASPDCFSTNGKTPHPNSRTAQGSTCDSCKQNAKGSGDDNESRACGFNVPIVAVPVIKDKVIVDSPFLWRLNSSTIFGESVDSEQAFSFRDLQAKLRQAAPNQPLAAFVVEAQFDSENDGMNKVVFKPLAYTSNEQALAIEGSEIDAEQMLNDVIPIMPDVVQKADDAAEAQAESATQETEEEEANEEQAPPPPAKKAASKKKVSKKKVASKPKPQAESADNEEETPEDPAAATAEAALKRAAEGEGEAGGDEENEENEEDGWGNWD